MADKTGIEWTDATWNPIVGCSIVSKGCTNCYAMRTAGARTKHTAKYEGLTKPSKAGPVWTGEVRFWEKALTDPLKWKEPRKIFVNSMGDLFAENVPNEWIDRCFAVMALCPQHTFQVLTKRPARMRAYLSSHAVQGRVARAASEITPFYFGHVTHWPLGNPRLPPWPLPGIWLGVSCEDQATADERIPLLLGTPAAIRFISAEPLLGSIDLIGTLAHYQDSPRKRDCAVPLGRQLVDWVIVGGESGPGARPMHPDWARSLRDQCQAAGVRFFFKQWGRSMPIFCKDGPVTAEIYDGPILDGIGFVQVGKKLAGRLLDGREWNEFPESHP